MEIDGRSVGKVKIQIYDFMGHTYPYRGGEIAVAENVTIDDIKKAIASNGSPSPISDHIEEFAGSDGNGQTATDDHCHIHFYDSADAFIKSIKFLLPQHPPF